MNYTLSYSDSVEGWTSFFSFYPDWMIGMNNYFYTFKGGNLYRHNVNDNRNEFYGEQFTSIIKSVFNDAPLENKLFKTLNLEGDNTWDALLETDIQSSGYIQSNWFEKKEQSWFGFVRNEGTTPASISEYALRSLNGIGRSASITGAPNAKKVSYQISPEPIAIGSIVSIGDYLYYSLPPTYATPVLFGEITDIVVDYPSGDNYLIVDSTILGGSVPPISVPYTLYIKNSVAESHGVLGHYCVFTLENSSVSKVELFAVESNIMKSYP